MKQLFTLALMLCALSLSACTRDATMQPTASPTPQTTAAPVMPDDMTGTDAPLTPGDMPSNQMLQDGVYAAEMSDAYVTAEGHGWQDYLKITVAGSRVAEVEFDSLKDGKKKSTVSAAEYPMNPPASEWIPKLNEAIRKAEVPEAMDTISGATMSSNNARRMYAALLEHARTGNTDIVVLDGE